MESESANQPPHPSTYSFNKAQIWNDKTITLSSEDLLMFPKSNLKHILNVSLGGKTKAVSQSRELRTRTEMWLSPEDFVSWLLRHHGIQLVPQQLITIMRFEEICHDMVCQKKFFFVFFYFYLYVSIFIYYYFLFLFFFIFYTNFFEFYFIYLKKTLFKLFFYFSADLGSWTSFQ